MFGPSHSTLRTHTPRLLPCRILRFLTSLCLCRPPGRSVCQPSSSSGHRHDRGRGHFKTLHSTWTDVLVSPRDNRKTVNVVRSSFPHQPLSKNFPGITGEDPKDLVATGYGDLLGSRSPTSLWCSSRSYLRVLHTRPSFSSALHPLSDHRERRENTDSE